jgi:hypothetical protein
MARFDVAASPGRAFERGFYVKRPGRSVAEEISTRVELRPASKHLLVGGIGSGKTTQLLIAQDRLNTIDDIRAIYLDVSTKHDLSRPTTGVLLALAGLALAELAPENPGEELLRLKAMFAEAAHGRSRVADPELGEEYGVIWEDGVLSPPGPPGGEHVNDRLSWETPAAAEALASLLRAVAQGVHVVLIFDSIDRLTDPRAFADLVENDVAAIHWAGIGVVLAGPQSTMYGAERAIADRFDYFYHQPWVDTQQDLAGRDFLRQVLRARAGEEILPDPCGDQLVELSGGVLRDLITLAQGAFEEAYLSGADQITPVNVGVAADAFGRKHLLGLRPDEIEVLQRVRTKGIFVPTSDKEIALLVTRRVLEYQNGNTRYAVHPTIRSLLEQLSETP